MWSLFKPSRGLAPILFLALVLIRSGSQPSGAIATTASFSVHDLGTLGGAHSFALDINNIGQIVGWSTNADGLHRAFLWQNGFMRDLGDFGGGSSYAYAINDRGQIVGESSLFGGGYHAFLWENGRMTDLGTMGGQTSKATGINEHGEIVGVSYTFEGDPQAFLWRDGRMEPLDLPVSELGRPSPKINNQRQVVAGAFLWSKGTSTVLGDPDGLALWAEGINNHGQVVGWAEVNGRDQTFLWQDGTITDLRLAGRPAGINDTGQIAGWYINEHRRGRAYLWKNGTRTDLGTLGGAGSEAYALNDRGDVVGTAETASGHPHAALWTTSTVLQPPRLFLPSVSR